MTGPAISQSRIPTSTQIGKRSFSSPRDYEAYFVACGRVANPHEVWESPNLAVEVQRHWYSQGQVGCLFARRAAGHHESLGWQTNVIMLDANELSPAATVGFLDESLAAATFSPTSQLISFLFPKIREPDALVHLIWMLVSTGVLSVAHAEAFGDITTVSLWATVRGSTVVAWVLGLGPFQSLPPTRQAPSTEIIIRPKIKPPSLFYRVNQDRSVAHLADAPLHIPQAFAERLWTATLRSVREILGHAPDHFSAAKTTFCVPTQAWNASVETGQI